VRKLVVDLSVWIDLRCGGVLETFLSTGSDIITSDAQLAEIEKEKGINLDPYLGLISCQGYSASEITEAAELVGQHAGLSLQDILAYLLAKRIDAILITGDKGLRRLAETSGIECHGTLWVLDALVTARAAACESLKLILLENTRLPRDEVEKRLRSWCS
jgi:predicted PilT family ATPase